MGAPLRFTKEQVLEAIDGCGGIVLPVSRRLGCAWDSAKKFIDKWAETRQAFENERATFLDSCESVLVRNVQLALKAQAGGDIADSSDAKWVVSRLGKERGWAERQEITGADGENIVVTLKWNDNAESDG